MKLSIIIPAWKDEDVKSLLKNLEPLNAHEIIVATDGSRASAMNNAVKKSTGDILWFLHSDSIVSEQVISCVQSLIKNPLKGLYYFNLKFTEPSLLMSLNTLGVYLRCLLFKLPFGDQGFLINKQTFLEIGAYNENLKYGEDHILIWQAKRANIPVLSTGTFLATSARKYIKNGWLKTTFKHQVMFYKQVYEQIKIRRN